MHVLLTGLASRSSLGQYQNYSRLRCLLRVKGLVICFYLVWSGSILQFRQNIIKIGSKSWLLTCSSNITLSLPSYTGSVLKKELNFCNGYLSLLYFWAIQLSSFFKLEIGRKYLSLQKLKSVEYVRDLHDIIKWKLSCLSDPNYAHKCLFHCIGEKLNY